MGLKDAAVIGAIAATATMVLTNIANASLGVIQADPAQFLFDCGKTWLVSFVGNLISLAGLEALVKRTQE